MLTSINTDRDEIKGYLYFQFLYFICNLTNFNFKLGKSIYINNKNEI